MKSLTKAKSPRLALQTAQVQVSVPIAGVPQEVRSAFFGLCVNASKANAAQDPAGPE